MAGCKRTSKQAGPAIKSRQPQTLKSRADAMKELAGRIHPEPCERYCCSEFVNMVEPHILRDTSDLDNAILEVFAEKNFTGVAYDDITMVLRLASLMLQSDALVPFWNIMMHGEIRITEGERKGEVVASPSELQVVESEDDGEIDLTDIREHWFAMYPQPGQDEVNKSTRGSARKLLLQMARMVELHSVGDTENGISGTSYAIQGPLNRDLAALFPHGCRSRIELDPKLLSDVYQGEVYRRDPGRWEREWTSCEWAPEHAVLDRMRLAITLVHEFAHALVYASVGNTMGEPQYWDSGVVEAGFEAEVQLLGGTSTINTYVLDGEYEQRYTRGYKRNLQMDPKAPRPFMLITRSPSPGVQALYDEEGGEMDTRGHLPGADTHFRVPTLWVQELFRARHWQAKQPIPVDAFRPEQNLGWTFIKAGGGNKWAPVPGGNALLPRKVLRARIKRAIAGDEGPELSDEASPIDWPDLLSESFVWVKMFDFRTASQRKREKRRVAKVAARATTPTR